MSWECKKCTMCCRDFLLPIQEPSGEQLEFLLVRGFKVTRSPQTLGWAVVIEGECRHLQPDNSCDIYESRPAVCRKYTCEQERKLTGRVGWRKV